jgi:hypothetical protein
MGRIIRASSLILVGLFLVLPAARPAGAHTTSTFYAAKWRNANGGDTTPDWHFMVSVPFGGTRDRIVQGAQQWNAQYQTFSFVGPLAGDYGDWQEPCARPAFNGNAVRYMPVDGPGKNLAWADVCPRMYDTWQYTNFLITIDNAELWNTTGGDTPDVNNTSMYDLWGTVAHEFGHATGWGTPWGTAHFGEYDTSTCYPRERIDIHTMCPYTKPGSDRERTLEYHDYEVFRAAY